MRTLLLIASALIVLGCGSGQEPMTKAEQENFKGGPMPAGFLEKHGGTPAAQAPK